MQSRLDRFSRLLDATSAREALLREELMRSRLRLAGLNRELAALQPAERLPAGSTAAAHVHAERHAVVTGQRREGLLASRREARRQESASQRRLVRTAQTRRALERLTARLQRARQEQYGREEQAALDEHHR